MKKLLIAIIVIISMASCKKEGICYECTFGIVNGVIHEPVTYCGPDGATHEFTDAEGNQLNASCKLK